MGKIDDPAAKKPEDWVDEAKIVDPDAKKPDDWDDEDDGEWEAPMIDNPDYKGEWKPKMIDNPEYKYDENMYKVCKDGCAHVGFEIWQVKTGTPFDDIIVSDSIEEAEEYAQKTFFKKKDGEKKMYDEHMEKQKADDEASMDSMDDDYMGDMGDFDMDGRIGDHF